MSKKQFCSSCCPHTTPGGLQSWCSNANKVDSVSWWAALPRGHPHVPRVRRLSSAAHYAIWCDDNGFAPLKSRTVSDFLISNASKYHIEHTNNIHSVDGRQVWGVKASGSWLTLVSAAGTDCSEFMTRMTHSHELRISARSYVHT